jgi:hypothetical protein
MKNNATAIAMAAITDLRTSRLRVFRGAEING